MTQTVLHFDGDTYDSSRDRSRLSVQLDRVRLMMQTGKWWTLSALEEATGHPQASISARLRDLRKPKFGGYEIERRYIRRGLFEYRMRAKP